MQNEKQFYSQSVCCIIIYMLAFIVIICICIFRLNLQRIPTLIIYVFLYKHNIRISSSMHISCIRTIIFICMHYNVHILCILIGAFQSTYMYVYVSIQQWPFTSIATMDHIISYGYRNWFLIFTPYNYSYIFSCFCVYVITSVHLI